MYYTKFQEKHIHCKVNPKTDLERVENLSKNRSLHGFVVFQINTEENWVVTYLLFYTLEVEPFFVNHANRETRGHGNVICMGALMWPQEKNNSGFHDFNSNTTQGHEMICICIRMTLYMYFNLVSWTTCISFFVLVNLFPYLCNFLVTVHHANKFSNVNKLMKCSHSAHHLYHSPCGFIQFHYFWNPFLHCIVWLPWFILCEWCENGAFEWKVVYCGLL